MRIVFAALAAALLATAVTPAAASQTAQSTIVLSDGRMIYISGRCHIVLFGGGGYCVNRVMGR